MSKLPTRVRSWLEGLRFPVLVLLAAALFVVDLFVPDALPFVDEALLALLAILLARFKRRRALPESGAGDSGGNDADTPRDV